MKSWEVVIGLEIHIQLKTISKLFSGAPVEFGAEPNANACAIDLGMPGTLPVPNAKAFDMAIQLGLALDCTINNLSMFERKNYFYPDLPKGYQTTQLQKPIIGSGEVTLSVDDQPFAVRIHHAHLEEDAGKSIHDLYPGQSAIDLNRAGTALVELVTEPDMRNSKQAVKFLRFIHQIVTYLDISDGDMSQGSMRCDANVSIRPLDESKLGTRTELKNINSFRFVEQAINIEVDRQIDILESGGTIVQETRLFDERKLETRSMRSKEFENDYRYFPCPDLLPVYIEPEQVAALKSALVELPTVKEQRFAEQYQLNAQDIAYLVRDKNLADYFEQVVSGDITAQLGFNWLQSELGALLNKNSLSIAKSPVTARQLAFIIQLVIDDKISGKMAKQLLELTWQANSADTNIVQQLVKQHCMVQVSDSGQITQVVTTVIAENPDQVANYKKADPERRKKMLGFFVGQVMKVSKGQANPKLVNREIKRQLQ